MDDPDDDPLVRCARPRLTQASYRITTLCPDDPALTSTLSCWDWVARSLLSRGVAQSTRARLEDSRRIVGEMLRVLNGVEPGEGLDEDRQIRAVSLDGRIQALTSLYFCPRAVFIELLVTAPWNLLGPDDPPDSRTLRGAGCALVTHAAALSRSAGSGGRVALQAENARSLEVYRRLGFVPMRPSDVPLGLVPRGPDGWSPGVVRLARGAAGPEERRMPWLVLNPSLQTQPRAGVVSAVSPIGATSEPRFSRFRGEAGAAKHAASR